MDIFLLEWVRWRLLQGGLEDNEFGEILGPFILYMNGDLVEIIGSLFPSRQGLLPQTSLIEVSFSYV